MRRLLLFIVIGSLRISTAAAQQSSVGEASDNWHAFMDSFRERQAVAATQGELAGDEALTCAQIQAEMQPYQDKLDALLHESGNPDLASRILTHLSSPRATRLAQLADARCAADSTGQQRQ